MLQNWLNLTNVGWRCWYKNVFPYIYMGVSSVYLCVYFLPLYPLLRAQMVEGDYSHVPGFTNKSPSFSFKSPQNINRPHCNQFTTRLKCGISPPPPCFARSHLWQIMYSWWEKWCGRPVGTHFNGSLHVCRIEMDRFIVRTAKFMYVFSLLCVSMRRLRRAH